MKYYLKLIQFYDNKELFTHLDNTFNYLQYLIELSEKTPFFAESGGQIGDSGYIIENKDKI